MTPTDDSGEQQWPDDVSAIIDHVERLEERIRHDRAACRIPAVHRGDLVRAADRLRALARSVPADGRPAVLRPGTAESVSDRIWHHIRAIERLQQITHPSGAGPREERRADDPVPQPLRRW